MPPAISLHDLEQEILKLDPKEQLRIVDMLIHKLIDRENYHEDSITWEALYGLGRSIWDEDAQDYVNQLREDRI